MSAASEAARVYYGYAPGTRWDEVWQNEPVPVVELWESVVDAAQTAQKAAQQNNGSDVDADTTVIIQSLVAEIIRLTRRVESLESLTRPLGSAKMFGEDAIESGKLILNLGSKVIKLTGGER